MITALNLANNFLEKGFQEKISISPMKLQKMLYILFKEYLKKTGVELFSERFEAWDYGPVLPSVYSEFKSYKANSIKSYSLDADFSVSKVLIEPNTYLQYVFDETWSKCKYKTGIFLSELTHKKDGAWQKAIDNKTYILESKDIKEENSYDYQ